MSTRWPGGIINQTAPVPSGSFASSAASGIWTLEQQAYWKQQGLWPIPGNFAPNIEDVFSTWLYNGTGLNVNNTIPNGIDLAGKGGLVWTKARNVAYNNALNDTVRGFSNYLSSNNANQQNWAGSLVTMTANSNGYTVNDANGVWNESGRTFCSWTFAKQPKFFDIVTYTGNGNSTPQTLSHNLGSVPGMIIVKYLNAGADYWYVWHRGDGTTPAFLGLNSTTASFSSTYGSSAFLSAAPTSTSFSVKNVGFDGASANATGEPYVAYLFAHNAGGFGASGNENVISCGSFTTDSGGNYSVNLGYEPQWVLVRRSSATDDWWIWDVMRGYSQTFTEFLYPNLSSAAVGSTSNNRFPTATGFQGVSDASSTFIYMAIRRPMAVPTVGTSVFTPVQNSNFTNGVVIPGQSVVDVSWSKQKDASNSMRIFDRLRGSSVSNNPTLDPSSTSAEANEPYWAMDQQNGVRITQTFGSTFNYINYFFTRRPGFFDVVCYTGTGSATTVAHNLTVAPELMIVKRRDAADRNWNTYAQPVGNNKYLILEGTNAATTQTTSYWNNTTPTASVFSLSGGNTQVNGSGGTYVAYLFATCPSVSKVGSYTGTGTTQVINCGFTTGSRFVLIKRTDSTGDWYVWDSARGIVAGNDPYLLLNSSAAEVTNTDFVDTAATGFELSSTAPAAINASGGSFIFLAIA
jgi:hypothetical protein